MRWGGIPRSRLSAILGVALTAYLIVLSLQVNQNSSHWLNRLEFLLYDLRSNWSLQWQPRQPGEQPIVIVDIDEASLAAQGRWPWSRHTLAQLVQKFSDSGVVVAAFDVVFSEPERNPVDEIRQHLPANNAWLSAQLHQQVDADRHFAAIMPATDVVLGFLFLEQDDLTVGQLPPAVYQLTEEQQQTLVMITKSAYAANLPALQQAAAGGGFVTTFADPDGAIRRSPLVIRYGSQVYPSLSLATVMTYLFDQQLQLETARVGSVDVLRRVGLKDQMARTDGSGRVIVPYRGRQKTYRYYSATDVLSGEVAAEQLEGAIVLVGASALGLADLRATPVGSQYPGVEVHANIIDTLLHDEFPYRPEWQAGATLAQLLLLGMLLSLWLPRLGPVAAIISSSATVLLALAGNFYLWHYHHLDLPLATIVLLIVGLTMLNLGYGFLRENASRRLLKVMFDQYVPPAHIDRMMADPQAYQFAGEHKQLTVLFSDIRGFTRISESLSASELKAFLNSYFTPITKVIFDNEGTIDKYVGDMVMAFWGAPLEDPRHAYHAVLTALEMQKLTRRLQQQFIRQGLPPVAVGVGVNSGPMNVGDMGSSYRRAYTVLGDAVNLGSRLESLTKYYGVDILVGEHTRQQAPEFVYRYIDRIQVKGKEQPVDVYEPLCLLAEQPAELSQQLQSYDSALLFYRQQQWQQARQAFDQLIEQYPQQAVYRLYRQRIDDLCEAGLGADWDGVFRHTAK